MNSKRIHIGKAFSYAWESVKNNFWYFVGLALIVGVIESVGNIVYSGGKNSWGLLGILLSPWITAGYLYILLSFYKSKKAPLDKVFVQGKYYLRALLATIWLMLIIGLGFVLFIIPGIYLALKYQFVLNLIVDKNIGVSEAMKESARMTEGVKMRLFVFDLACIGITIVGVLCFGVGLLVTMPIAWLAEIYIYKKLLTIEE
ncbi:MAG: DUF975 family protein [bacterium]